jgi:hypothetical protein
MELGLVTAKAVTDFLTLYGVSVSLETQDLTGTPDAWADTPEVFVTTTIQVLFNTNIKNDKWSKTGLLEDGDAIVSVKGSESIKIRDRLLKSNIEYEIVSIDNSEIQGVTGCRKLACKRLNTGVIGTYIVYYGEDTSGSLDEAGVKALRMSGTVAKYEGIYQMAAGGYKYIAIHPSLGTPSAFIDPNTGFAIGMEAAVVVSVTVGGVAANYNVYRSTNVLGGAIDIEVR